MAEDAVSCELFSGQIRRQQGKIQGILPPSMATLGIKCLLGSALTGKTEF